MPIISTIDNGRIEQATLNQEWIFRPLGGKRYLAERATEPRISTARTASDLVTTKRMMNSFHVIYATLTRDMFNDLCREFSIHMVTDRIMEI